MTQDTERFCSQPPGMLHINGDGVATSVPVSLCDVLTGQLHSGFDGVGERCNVRCNFGLCTNGFSAQCEVPVEGDPDIGTAPTICRACGQRGLKCCDDQVAGMLQYVFQRLRFAKTTLGWGTVGSF